MLRILHVDNSQFFKRLLDQVAKEYAFICDSVKSPADALNFLDQNTVDVIITGLEFQQGSGLDFVRMLNSGKHAGIPKVVLTSRDTFELRREADALGVQDYIPKDISLGSLFTFIEKLKNQQAVKENLVKLPLAVFSGSPVTMELIEAVLKRRGLMRYQLFTDPSDLIAGVSKFPMILADLDTLEDHGKSFIITLRKAGMENTLIVMTSDAHHEVVSDLLLSGADDYLAKPFNEKLLMARINASVRNQLHMQEIRRQKEDLEFINAELNRLVITDGLTQLYNRRYMMEYLAKEVAKAQRYRRGLALLMLDIDHFKRVNDEYGHQTGDAVLREVARIIRDNVRNCDIAGRYGGEEFIVILPEADLDGALEVGARIRRAVEEGRFTDQGLAVTLSGGVAVFEDDALEELVRKADGRLYEAKHSGRNRIMGGRL